MAETTTPTAAEKVAKLFAAADYDYVWRKGRYVRKPVVR